MCLGGRALATDGRLAGHRCRGGSFGAARGPRALRGGGCEGFLLVWGEASYLSVLQAGNDYGSVTNKAREKP